MDMRDRLVELLKDILPTRALASGIPVIQKWDYKAVADRLIENGVILPPCKVGDTVYYLCFGKIYKGKCHAISLHEGGAQIHLYDFDGDNARYSAKDVFLTREEAEKALEDNHAKNKA